MKSYSLIVVLGVVVLVASVMAFNPTECSEVPDCINEYQWKHGVKPVKADKFCQDRYPTCKNVSSASDMKNYCKLASPLCRSFILGYLGYSDTASSRSQSWCKNRLPRC